MRASGCHSDEGEQTVSFPSDCVIVDEESPEDFLQQHGRTGRVGLFGGSPVGHRIVRWGQSPITSDRLPSLWSHVVIFSEEKSAKFLYESDMDVGLFPPHLRDGAQRSPISKYFKERRWLYMSILDFLVTDDDAHRVLETCRRMIRQRVRYPVIGLIGTGLRYRIGGVHAGETGLDSRGLFCSTFVQKAFMEIGIRFHQGVPLRHTGPEHIWQSAIPHHTYLRRKEWEILAQRRI
jgi:hypothetical protein